MQNFGGCSDPLVDYIQNLQNRIVMGWRWEGRATVRVQVPLMSEMSVYIFLTANNLINRHFHVLWWTRCDNSGSCISTNEGEPVFCGRLSIQGPRVREIIWRLMAG